jgi:hypothetical protein
MSGKIKRLLLIVLLIPLWVFLRSVYRDRIGAFGCFDDCNTMLRGYFLLQGKHLYSQIFCNYMPAMPYISAVIQHVTNPDSIYMLIYQHRMFMIYFSIIADVFLVLRFGFSGFGFALLYESTKGFIFGDRFLAESMIVYVVVYLWGIVWETLQKKRISPLEIWLSVNLTWFAVFSREPYVPLALFLFGVIMWSVRKTIWAWWSTALLFLMSLATLLYFGIHDFIFNVFTANIPNIQDETTLPAVQAGGVWSVILYPFQIFFEGPWNLFHQTEVGLVMLLFILGIALLIKTKRYMTSMIIIVVLMLANIRPIIPGSLYYATYHHILWYALLVFTVVTLLVKVWKQLSLRWLTMLSVCLFLALCVYALVSRHSYIHEKVDRQTEFATNYSHFYAVGETIKRLSTPSDSLFIDGRDDLIYWQSRRFSHYPYSWYTAHMQYFPIYVKARADMLKNDPPDFFYGRCDGKSNDVSSMPPEYAPSYTRLLQNGTPSCLYIQNDKVRQITPDQWKSVEIFNYSL